MATEINADELNKKLKARLESNSTAIDADTLNNNLRSRLGATSNGNTTAEIATNLRNKALSNGGKIETYTPTKIREEREARQEAINKLKQSVTPISNATKEQQNLEEMENLEKGISLLTGGNKVTSSDYDTDYNTKYFDWLNEQESDTKRATSLANWKQRVIANVDDTTKNTYGVIKDKYGDEAAKEYAEYKQKNLQNDMATARQDAINQLATKNAANAAAYSVGGALMKPFAGAASLATNIASTINPNAEIDTTNAVNAANASITDTRSAISDSIDNKALSFLYNTGMSVADNLVNMGLMGGAGLGQAAMLGSMGVEAAADSVIENKRAGKSDWEALTRGLASGAIEAITEKMPLNNLMKGDFAKSTLKNILKQSNIEGLEEIGSDVLNDITDEIYDHAIRGESTFGNEVATLMDADPNLTEEEATKQALTNRVKRSVESYLGGAIAGGVLGGGKAFIDYSSANRTGKDVADSITDEDGKVDAASVKSNVLRAMDTSNAKLMAKAREMQDKLDNNEEVSAKEVQNLVRDTEFTLSQMDEEDAAKATMRSLAREVSNEGLEMSEGTEAHTLAKELQTKLDSNEDITLEDITKQDSWNRQASDYIEELSDETASKATLKEGWSKHLNNLNSLGENGRTVYSEAVEEALNSTEDLSGETARQIRNDINAAYTAGYTGESAVSSNFISDEKMSKLWESGRLDAENDIKIQKDIGVKRNRNAGVTIDDESVRQDIADGRVSTSTIKILNKIAKQTGVSIRVVGDYVQNGSYSNNASEIVVSTKSAILGFSGNISEDQAVRATFGHELTHRLKVIAPNAYMNFEKAVISEIGSKEFANSVSRVANLYKNSGLSATQAELQEESVADFVGRKLMTGDSAFLKKIANSIENETARGKFVNTIKDLAKRLRAYFKSQGNDAQARKLQKVEDAFAEFYDTATAKVSEMEETEIVDADFADNRYSLAPPYPQGSKALAEFVDNLNESAKKTYFIVQALNNIGRYNPVVVKAGVASKKPQNITTLNLRADEWNENVRTNSKFAKVAKELVASLPENIRKAARYNADGTITPSGFEEEFKMAESMMQRIVDALPAEIGEPKVVIDGKEYSILTEKGGRLELVGGEAYRRGLIEERRRLYREGRLKKRGLATLAQDKGWGAMGFIATNGKTTASGDFTTFCPQMYYNKGCYYCYRLAALKSGVNNKLVGMNVWYTGEILQMKQSDIDALNKNGGLRIQSFGDWMEKFSPQLADVLYDAALVGLQVKIITKEPSMIESVAHLRKQGLGKNLYFNLSADYTIEKAGNGKDKYTSPMNPKRPYMRKDGQMWWKRALTVEEAAEYHKKYPFVNTRIVATTLDEFIRGLKDPTVAVVTGYHGNIRQYERISSATGETLLEVEALGDNGMPRFAFDTKTNTWTTEYEGKTATHKKLAQAIRDNHLEWAYYTKVCCITGRCATCNGKCGKAANDFNVKNFTNEDKPSVAYWQKHMTSAEKNNLIFSKEYIESMADEVKSEKPAKNKADDRKWSAKDTNGKELSMEQAEFFKDSKAVDGNGNLKVVYHTTRDGGFTVFDPKYSDDNRSLFFSDSLDVSKTYGDYDPKQWKDGSNEKNVYYPVYLNLRNPLIVDAKGARWSAIKTDRVKLYKAEEHTVLNKYRFADKKSADKFKERFDYTELLDGYNKVRLDSLAEFEYDGVIYSWDNLDDLREELDIAEAKATSAYLRYRRNIVPSSNYTMTFKEFFDNYRSYGIFELAELMHEYFAITSPSFITKPYPSNAEYYRLYDRGDTYSEIVADCRYLVLEGGGFPFVSGEDPNTTFKTLPPQGEQVAEAGAYNTRELSEEAQREGYDGVIIKNVYDAAHGEDLKSTVMIAFNSNQVKSVDNTNPTEKNDIRWSVKDTEGNTLSKAQQKYFENSKIRDEDGNLRVVYHGTSEDFTVFDRKKSRSTMDIQGNFFTPWEDDAKGYGENVKAYYINITNPASESVAYKALNKYKGQNDAGAKAREDLIRQGYDGVNNNDEEYIAFYPEQIKLVTNRKPTADGDIRRSVRDVYGDTITHEESEAIADDIAKSLHASNKQSWMATRTNNGMANDAKKKQKVRPLSDIIAKIGHDYGIQITSGHVRGKNTLGTYDKKNKGIRSKVANDLPTISHELGHAIDDRANLIDDLEKNYKTDTEKAKIRDELIRLHADAYGGGHGTYQSTEWSFEGWAEYVRLYFQNSEETAAKYPLTTDYFKKKLDAKDLALFEEFADEVNAYYVSAMESATDAIRLAEESGADFRSVKEKSRDYLNKFYQNYIDSNDPIKRLDKETGSNTYMYATNVAYADAIAGNIINGDLTDINGQYVAPGLRSALTGVNIKDISEYRLFGEYLVMRHGTEWLKTDKDVLANDIQNNEKWMNSRAAKIEADHPAFKDAAERLYKLIDQFYRTWGVQLGTVEPNLYEALRKTYPNYVPFHRVGEKGGRINSNKKYANIATPIKTAHGTTESILHPVDSLMQDMNMLVRSGLNNNVMKKMRDSAIKDEANALYMERIPTPVGMKGFDPAVLATMLETNFGVGSVTDEMVRQITDLTTQYSKGKANGDIVTVLVDGNPEYWKINDEGLLNAITNMSPSQADGLLEAYGKTTRFLTANMTGNNFIWSIFSNMPRDLMTFFTFTKKSGLPKAVRNIGSAYVNMIKKNFMSKESFDNATNKQIQHGGVSMMYYKEFLAMGGERASAYASDIDYAKKTRKEFSRKNNPVLKVVNPIELVPFITDMIEQGPRFATYKLWREQGATPQKAFYEAMDITVNFRRGGIKSKQLNKAVPFFNASIQGIDKFARWLSADRVRTDRKKAVLQRTVAFTASSAILGFLMFLLNNGDDEASKNYELLSTYTKNSYWCIPTGGGKYFCVPKPREIAVLSSFFEALCEATTGDTHAFDDFYTYAVDNFLPSIASDIAKTPYNIAKDGTQEAFTELVYGTLGSFGIAGVGVDLVANRNFLGTPIESEADSNKNAEDAYNDSTSIMAEWLGKTFGLSPKRIDYAGKNILGYLWKIPMALFPVGEKEKDYTLGIANTYAKDNVYSADLTNWMYDKAEKSSKDANSNPDDIDKEITSKLDGTLKTFYSTFNKLNKDNTAEDDKRNAKRTALECIYEYRKACDYDDYGSLLNQVIEVARETGDTDIFPSAMSKSFKTKEGKEITYTDSQYVEFQTIYNEYYYGYLEDNLKKSDSYDTQKETIKAAKTTALQMAKNEMIVASGGTASSSKEVAVSQYGDKVSQAYVSEDKRNGISDSDWETYLSAFKKYADDNSSVSQDEVGKTLNSTNLSTSTKEKLWSLYWSDYTDKNGKKHNATTYSEWKSGN